MMLLWLGVLLMLLVAFGFVWWPLRQQKNQDNNAASCEQLNIAAFKSRLQELDEELEKGNIETIEYQELKSDIESNLLSDSAGQSRAEVVGRTALWLPFILMLAVSVSSLSIYQHLGESTALERAEHQAALSEKLIKLPLDERINLLQSELKNNSDNAELWFILARDYVTAGRYTDAVRAYELTLQVAGEDPGVLAEYAQTLFLLQGNKITAQVDDLTDRALAVEPNNSTALGLKGIAAFESKDYAGAVSYWSQVLEQNPSAASAEAIRSGIKRAQNLLVATDDGETTVKVALAQLDVEVSLDKDLASKAPQNTMVFVLARPVGGRMPLAVTRLQVKDLPATVRLDDSMAMRTDMKLSSFETVEVVARVSFSGQAISQSGDLIGLQSDINPKSSNKKVKVLIDEIVE